MIDQPFRGRTALVTGAATGLGWEVSRRLLEAGASVGMSYRPDGHSDGVAQLVEKFGNRAHSYACDLSDVASTEKLFQNAAYDMGGIDHLVNNAGTWLSGQFEDIPVNDWDLTFAINVRAPFILCQKMISQKPAKTTRKIVNVTSQAAFQGSTTGHAHYAASKAAIVTMTMSLAREVAQRGITANCIALGMMESNMVRDSITARPDYYRNRIPIGRIAQPSEIAPIVLFLLSPESDYMTGATVNATGGMLMR
ncbi:SDR family NAD(P)-dependent oxidoreductase [Cutibacterium avidum]|uniref:SDR family NAD(P)-dependent oxidoreductase n=1 Tax=Cutibacterium avidum TaxID=33010 RepID=UPI00083E717D|nr:SDR family oxidoreductase [Cutibacterium avidum]AOG28387.1 hypothetical protein BFS79_07530 [Cutibacterium avidum]